MKERSSLHFSLVVMLIAAVFAMIALKPAAVFADDDVSEDILMEETMGDNRQSESGDANEMQKAPQVKSEEDEDSDAEEPEEPEEPEEIKNGLISEDDGNTYYYIDGEMQVGQQKIDGNWYFFDTTSGAMHTGWKYLDAGSKWVYYGDDGVMSKGQKKIDNAWYYFDEKTGARVTGWKNIAAQNKIVYYDTNGQLVRGQKKIDGNWYYFDEKTGARITGWKNITAQNKVVYYDANGRLVYGQQKIDGNWYYFNEKTGARVSGWKYWSDGKKWVYYQANGAMAKGQVKVNGAWYYFNEKTGARVSGWKYWSDGKKWVYYAANGKMTYGDAKIGGYWYYFNTKTGKMHIGWLKLTADTYYYDTNGHMVTGTQTINGKTYLFASDGKLQKYLYPLAADKLNSIGWNLIAAYNWSTGIRYVNSGGALNAGSNWYATYGFTNGYGDCYVKAATFYQMARQLGYSARQMVGYVPRAGGGLAIHSWCEVDMNGGTYVVDPDFAYETGKNGYLIYYGQSGTWRYQSYSVYGE